MSLALSVRPAIAADVAQMVRVISGQPLWKRYGYKPVHQAGDLEKALAGDDLLIVAEENARLMGLAWVEKRGAFGRSPYLRILAVEAGAERMGIGSRLLVEAEERVGASTRGMSLLVSDFNRAARDFYERYGYVEAGMLVGFVLPDVTELIYWKGPARSLDGSAH
jgi:ribosomal protein S18 acetylase RimI-like enzyme